jgi:hypothetical protein
VRFSVALIALYGLASFAAGPAHAIEGKLTGVYADSFEAGTSETRWRLDTGNETVPVLPTELPALAPGHNTVEVTGRREAGSVVGPAHLVSAPASPLLGARKTAVIAVNFADDASQPWTPAQLRQRVFTNSDSTSAFFREESHGQVWLTGRTGNLNGDVYGYYTIGAAAGGCNYASWASQAKVAAAADGFVAGSYQHVIYIFPQRSCPWSGLAYLPGTESWINGQPSTLVTAHELGHNLGLNHAGSWNCTSGGVAVTLSANCSVSEYNDPFDVMGNHAARHSHGWHLERLGYLGASNVQTISAPGVYSMTSALAPTSEPTTLRIPRTRDSGGNPIDWYYLETRARGGVFDNFSPADPLVGGVSIRVNDNPTSSTRSKLLDAHPGTGGIGNAPLAPGETFSDGQLSISTVSAGGGAATVAISMPGGPADTQAPSPPSAVRHSFTAAGHVRLEWAASTDNTGVRAYPVLRDGVPIARTGATSVDTDAAPAGAHVYTVYAEDFAGNRSSASAAHTVVIPGAALPAGRHKALAGDRRGPRIRLERRGAREGALVMVARARDAAAVRRLTLFVDGRRVGSAKRASLRYRLKGSPGLHRVRVVAVDGKGNRSSLERRLRLS